TPRHFHSSTTSGSACLMSIRTRASVSPRQSLSSLILASIRREGTSPPFPSFAPLFVVFMVGVAFLLAVVAIVCHSYPLIGRPLRHLVACGSTNRYRPVSRSAASGSSTRRPTQTTGSFPAKATMLTMTATVKAMDSQRWICRTQLLQFTRTSFEHACAGTFHSARVSTSSSLAKNRCHPYLAP